MSDLFEHQKRFLLKGTQKDALIWSCGTGKTRTALEWAKCGPGVALVICPKSLKENWQRESARWKVKTRVMTKEEFKKWYMQGNAQPTAQVIVDEVHNGFLTPQFKSQMSKCLRDYIKKYNVPRVLLLTATVYTSSPWNIFNLATLLGLHWSWMNFNLKYFVQVRMGGRMVPMPKKGVEKDMAELVKQIADVVDIHECMDVPEQLHTDPEYFTLTSEQERGINDSYDPVHIKRITKRHEVENGVLIGDSNGLIPDQFFKTDKMDRIKQIVAENDKVAIVARYNLQIDSIRDNLSDCGKPVFIIRGEVKNRDEITLAAESAKQAVVIIQADCAEGYQLPSFEVCVFASQSYSYAKFEQICGRFLRMDKPSRTTFMYLISGEDSVDQAVYDCVQKKQDFQIQLYKKDV